MKLYHGTSEYASKLIRARGLLPRKAHGGQHNWKHAFVGNQHAVYLTDAYPITYAVEAVDNSTRDGERLALIEVDTEALNPANLVPDEDVLEQSLRGHDELPADWPMLRRCRHYRSQLRNYADQWEKSLRLLGTCGYMDSIPPEAIGRIVLIDYRKAAKPVWIAMNASVSLANYRLVGARHKAITKWFFDDPLPEVTDRDLLLSGDFFQEIAGLSRDGIEIVDHP